MTAQQQHGKCGRSRRSTRIAKHSTPRHGGNTKHDSPRDHYAAVTDQVIAALEAGTLPWRKPWDPERPAEPACHATPPRAFDTGA
jgi:antirestriction protein ArdC